MSRKSTSGARSAPRADGKRVARYAARLDRELACEPPNAAGVLEAALARETLLRVGQVMGEFAAMVAGARSHREREQRLVLPGATLPPLP